MRVLLFILSFGIFGFLGAQSQRYSSKPDVFIEQFKEAAYKSGNTLQKAQLDSFVVFWNAGGLTENQQKNIMKTAETLASKRQRPLPTFVQMGNSVRHAIDRKNISTVQMDTLTQIFAHAVENYEPKKYQFLFKTLESYTSENLLFQSKSHKFYAMGNNFNFRLIEGFGGGDGTFEDTEETFGGFDEWDNDSESDDDWEDDSWDDETWEEDTEIDETEEEGLSDEFIDALYSSEKVELDGPIIHFKGTYLLLVTPQDTININNTHGDFSLIDGTFSGEGGNIDWSSVGLSTEVHAEFNNYSFSVKKPEIKAEDVLMHHPEKLEGDVKGILEYRYSFYKEKPKYPRFMSYKNDIAINDFPNHIKYKGGFAMNGDKVFSSCVSGAPSTITVADSGQVRFKAMAKYFELGDSVFRANPSRVVLYFGEDSIGHPGARLIYNDASKDLSVRKDVTTYKEAPFSNSYHVLDMDVDQIDWNFKDTVMTMVMVGAKNEVPAFFESVLNYSETKYIHLKGYFAFHPLQMIMNYCKKKKKKEFTIEEIASYYKKKEFTIKTAIGSLNKKGFVTYNKLQGTARLTEKAIHFYKSRRGKTDYDVLSVQSLKPSNKNAILDMQSYDLTVDGVDRVILSDSNDVIFFPKGRKIVLQKNRNIEFDGTVTTNNYIFNGRDFKFSYDSFNLDLVHIDSIEFYIEVTDTATGETKKEKIDNKLTYSEGTLTIDAPNNKSGLVRNPRYPHFDANHGAAVLFNKPDILDGVYDTTFRYQIPPFAVDSLSGDIESTVSFDGEFHSGGVFPVIKQELEVQNDNGFGFTHEAPEEGYPIFDGEATFFGTITLGKNGLRGDGKIIYLNTTLESMDFVFYKDSVKGLGDVANTISGIHPDLDPSITFPECIVTDYEMVWYPSQDSMYITNYENAFKLYNDEAKLSGALIISDKGMQGTGIVETHRSLTISKQILLKERTFSAQKGQFEILSDVVGKPALRSDYVNVDFDLDKQKASFSPAEEGYASNNFPYLKYKTSLNDGFWNIKDRVITMEKPYDMDISDSYFYSTKRSQDSLAFNATKAYYFIDSLKLLVEGVQEIEVADAKIYPDSNKLEIKENAKIVTLRNARIVMDTLNEYHNLIGNIDINSKKDFDGNADYQFVTFKNDTIPIVFNKFQLEPVKGEDGNFEYHTVSRGSIAEGDTFVIAPKMFYKGEVIMYANKRLLSLDGYIKLELENNDTNEPLPWLRYENSEDVDQIRIDLDDQEDLEMLAVTNGLHYQGFGFGYYSTFLSKKNDGYDPTAFPASGYLVYDLETTEFKITDRKRIEDQTYKGNSFGFSETENYYDYQGEFKLINPEPEIPHHFNFDFGGEGKHDLTDSTLELSGLGVINFEVPTQVMKPFGSKISLISRYYANTAKPSQIHDTLYKRLASVTTEKEILKYVKATELKDINPAKSFKLFKDAIVLNDINLIWNVENKSWHTEGPLGIISIAGYPVDCYLKGYLEIKKTPEEDQINFYLEGGPGQWYYFSYSGNALYISSSDSELNKFVESKNTEAKNLPRNLYYWTVGDEEDLTRFKSSYIRDYLDGQDIAIDNSNVPTDNNGNDNEFEEIEDEFEEIEDEFEEIDEFEEEFEDLGDDGNDSEFEEIDDSEEEFQELEEDEFEEIDSKEDSLETSGEETDSEKDEFEELEEDEFEEMDSEEDITETPREGLGTNDSTTEDNDVDSEDGTSDEDEFSGSEETDTLEEESSSKRKKKKKKKNK